MKKITLAACVASLALISTATQADSTVRGQAKATPMPATAAAASAPTASPVTAYHSPYAEFEAMPGNKRSIFQLDFMIPVYQMLDRMLFVDLRGMLDTKQAKEGNLGLGYRHIVNNSVVLGVYGYGDVRRTKARNTFAGGTFGVEALSNFVDGRVNVYITGKKAKRIGKGVFDATFTGNTIQAMGLYEQAMNGFDGEIGLRIPTPGVNNLEARVFAGGYYFSRSGAKKVSGPRGRFEVRLLDLINPGSRLTLGVEVLHDKVRKTNVFGHIGIRIPLNWSSGGKAPQGLQSRLADKVYRDVDVVTTEPIKQPIPGATLNLNGNVLCIDSGKQTGGKGTFEDPLGRDEVKKVTSLAAYSTVVVLGKETIEPGTLKAPTSLWITGTQKPVVVADTNGNSYVVSNIPVSSAAPTIKTATPLLDAAVATQNGVSLRWTNVNYEGPALFGGNIFTGNATTNTQTPFGVTIAGSTLKTTTAGVGGSINAIVTVQGTGSSTTIPVKISDSTVTLADGTSFVNTHTSDGATANVSATGVKSTQSNMPLYFLQLGSTDKFGKVTFTDTNGIYTTGTAQSNAAVVRIHHLNNGTTPNEAAVTTSGTQATNMSVVVDQRILSNDAGPGKTAFGFATNPAIPGNAMMAPAKDTIKLTNKTTFTDNTVAGAFAGGIGAVRTLAVSMNANVESTKQNMVDISSDGSVIVTGGQANAHAYQLDAQTLNVASTVQSTVSLTLSNDVITGVVAPLAQQSAVWIQAGANTQGSAIKVATSGVQVDNNRESTFRNNNGGAVDGAVQLTWDTAKDVFGGATGLLMTSNAQDAERLMINGKTLRSMAVAGNVAIPNNFSIGGVLGADAWFDVALARAGGGTSAAHVAALVSMFGANWTSIKPFSQNGTALNIGYY